MSEAALAMPLDKDALRELAMRYCRAIDRRDPVLLASVYHESAHGAHGTAFDGPAADFIAGLQKGMTAFEVTQHQTANTSYRFDGDRAEGELCFTACHRTVPPAPKHMTVRGRYLDRYERRNGEWRIVYRYLVWDSYETAEVLPDDTAMLVPPGESGAAEGDYSYRALEMLGRGR